MLSVGSIIAERVFAIAKAPGDFLGPDMSSKRAQRAILGRTSVSATVGREYDLSSCLVIRLFLLLFSWEDESAVRTARARMSLWRGSYGLLTCDGVHRSDLVTWSFDVRNCGSRA